MEFTNLFLPKRFMRFVRNLSIREFRNYYFYHYRYKFYPRFCKLSLKLFKRSIQVPDLASFLSTYHEIFISRIYEFKTDNERPLIIDLGANIGLSVIFFKLLFDHARIIALEPDRNIFQFLTYNISAFGFSDIELINKAAWSEDAELRFKPDGADGGRVQSTSKENTVTIQALDLNTLLGNYTKIDFMKMDIEGSESIVFPHIESNLVKIENIFIEYHSLQNEVQNLDLILSILKRNGFRYYIESFIHNISPFKKIECHSGFDVQLNIFARNPGKII